MQSSLSLNSNQSNSFQTQPSSQIQNQAQPPPLPNQVQNQNQNQNQLPTPVRRTSVVVDTASCLPSKGSKKAPEESIDTTDHLPPVPSISAPTTFKHAVKVTFNQDLSRYIYLIFYHFFLSSILI